MRCGEGVGDVGSAAGAPEGSGGNGLEEAAAEAAGAHAGVPHSDPGADPGRRADPRRRREKGPIDRIRREEIRQERVDLEIRDPNARVG